MRPHRRALFRRRLAVVIEQQILVAQVPHLNLDA
jgi:hypothetical protein